MSKLPSLTKIIEKGITQKTSNIFEQIQLLTHQKQIQDSRVSGLELAGDLEKLLTARKTQEAMSRVLFKLHTKNRKNNG